MQPRTHLIAPQQLTATGVERQQIPVTRVGLQAFLEQPGFVDGESVWIQMQGSIEQCFADYMQGVPHHLHADCRRLEWRLLPANLRRYQGRSCSSEISSFVICVWMTLEIARGSTTSDERSVVLPKTR